MLAAERRSYNPTTLEKAEQYGSIPEKENHTQWVSVKARKAVPMSSQEDKNTVSPMVGTYVKTKLIQSQRQQVVAEPEISRNVVRGVLGKIFKISEEDLRETFSQENLDKLVFENKHISIESEGMSEVIVAFLKKNPIQALDLRSFSIKDGALEELFSALPETQVKRICISQRLTPEETHSKERAERILSDHGRTLQIMIRK